MKTIEVNSLTKDYGAGRGIFDVSLSVEAGEMVGFVGTNGSGKTTTIRHMMGFLRPTSGHAAVQGLEAWQHASQVAKFVGYVPGEIAFPDLPTGTAFLKSQAEFLGLKQTDTANALIEELQMDPRASLKRMSKGMKQKTALVAALMYDAPIILLDEPTTGLDPLMREAFLDIIREEHARGKTIFMSSHMFEELEKTCDRVAMISDGHLVDIADMRSIRNRSNRDFKIEFHSPEDYLRFREQGYRITRVQPAYSQVTVQLGAVMYALNPAGQFDAFYTEHGEQPPETYDVAPLAAHVAAGDTAYASSAERKAYIRSRVEECAAVFLAGNMTREESVDAMLDALSEYGVSEEQYEAFGYTYASLKDAGMTAILTFEARYAHGLEALQTQQAQGAYADEAAYTEAVDALADSLTQDITGTLLSTLPQEVSDGLEELGTLDMYGLIVGTVFYKMAGLLLPIIYMIMASNNLIAGQVDSGSMAYVLSTSTKRRQVTFTQAVYLVGSLLAMFACTTVTGLICLSRLDSGKIALTSGKLLLLNLGAFLVLFALSGVCFCASCWFNRSRYSMSLGGGLSMFALVSTMLGLFGSSIIPSVIRLDALNNFNYVTIITLFDTISIINGTTDYIWKLAILAAIGLTGYIVGSIRFRTKDLPL